MSNIDKTTYIQLEKAYETACKAKVKIDLIDKHYDEMFVSNDDYQSLKQSYILEEKYATLKCKDIISNSSTLKEKRNTYKKFSSLYKSKRTIFDISLVFIPLFVGGIVYSILQNSSLIWLFASLSLISIGTVGYIYFNTPSSADEYMGPSSMQIKVLKRIDSLLISGQIYDEVVKDCQLQFAKRKLISKAKEKSSYINYDLTETNTYPRYVENYIYSYSALTNIKNLNSIRDYYKSETVTSKVNRKKASDSSVYAKYVTPKKSVSTPITVTSTSSSSTSSKKKASDSSVYAKYMSSKKTTESTSTPITVASTSSSSTSNKKKASDSSVYAKYMSSKKTTESTSTPITVNSISSSSSSSKTSTPVTVSSSKSSSTVTSSRKKASESPTYLKYKGSSMSSKFNSKKTVVARYEGNSTITRVALDIDKPKSSRKKASESSVYQKYLQQKNTAKVTSK